MSIVMYCSAHPAYQGKHHPRVSCSECAVLYDMVRYGAGRPHSWRFLSVAVNVGRRIRGKLR